MRAMHKLLLGVLAGIVAVTFLAAALAGDGEDRRAASSRAGNSTDVAFTADMVGHHAAAIRIARLAHRRAEHPELWRMAGDMVRVQRDQIAVLNRVVSSLVDARARGRTIDPSAVHVDPQMSLGALRSAEPFDRAFIDAMIPHHQAGIAVARTELSAGEHPALRAMARDVIAVQDRQVAAMRIWRDAWYGRQRSSGADQAP